MIIGLAATLLSATQGLKAYIVDQDQTLQNLLKHTDRQTDGLTGGRTDRRKERERESLNIYCTTLSLKFPFDYHFSHILTEVIIICLKIYNARCKSIH